MISGLEEDETINKIVKNKVRRVIVSSQSGLLNKKLSIRIIIIVITILIIVIIIIIIIIIFTLSRADANTDNKILINLI